MQALTFLLQSLCKGEKISYSKRMKKGDAPTISDVARLAGVSTASVSRYFNSPDVLVENTRNRIQSAVNQLNYMPNFSGKALASNQTNTIGAVIPTMENAIFARALQAFQECLEQAGITLLVSSSGYDADVEAAQIRKLIGNGADGLMLIGKDRAPEIHEFLRQRGVPFVVAWTIPFDPAIRTIGFDNRLAAIEIANRVLDLGHRRIGIIGGHSANNDRARHRIQGYVQAAEAAEITIPNELILECAYSLEEGQNAMFKLMSSTPRPTAILCGNDVLAIGAIQAAKSLEFSIPEDLSIVGFDDIDLATVVEPGLTTVHVPHRRMGASAAETLIAMRKKEPVENTVLETSIVDRGSLGPAPYPS